MIDWKHVDYIIKALGMLPREILSKCEVSLIGNGDQEDDLKKLMHENGLDDCITFKSSMASSEILEFMQDLDVYIFPSDRKEGWGAALLEAMDKGCAVIANAAAGSTLEVVEDGVNGFVFDDGDIMTLAERIVCLVKNDDLRWDMGRKAWKTIQQWSPHVGAERLVGLIQAIKKGEYTNSFTSGLCNRVDS
jgi:glycosyltransferase involved in cell wall biosynthesis